MPVDQLLQTDVLIIGTEGAGMRAAIAAREEGAEVLAISKLYQARSGSTICAPGDYACDARALAQMGMHDFVGDDSCDMFFEDVMASGQRINDPELARIMVEQAPERLRDLVSYGAKFDRVFHYGGHRAPRGASMGRVGKTGVAVMQTLGRRAGASGAKLLQGCTVVDILIKDGTAVGALGVDLATGDYTVVTARSVILATGGAARAFDPTSNPEEATGDGMGMAYRSGAHMIDMEMMQFIPYAQATPMAMRGNIHFAYELVSLLPSYLVNSLGERFMSNYDPERMEKSTRDFLSLGIASEVAAGRGSANGGAYVALDHIDKEQLQTFASEMFPQWRVGAFSLLKFGYDPSQHAVEITPAAHYSCGGVAISADCETTVDGLFAAGEVAGAVHGANRLSGTALTETQVFGAIAGRAAARRAMQGRPLAAAPPIASVESAKSVVEGMRAGRGEQTAAFRESLYAISAKHLGVLRSGPALETLPVQLSGLRGAVGSLSIKTSARGGNLELQRALESRNLVDVLEMTALSAIERRESRGGHHRIDYAQMNPAGTNTVLHYDGWKTTVSTREVTAAS